MRMFQEIICKNGDNLDLACKMEDGRENSTLWDLELHQKGEYWVGHRIKKTFSWGVTKFKKVHDFVRLTSSLTKIFSPLYTIITLRRLSHVTV